MCGLTQSPTTLLLDSDEEERSREEKGEIELEVPVPVSLSPCTDVSTCVHYTCVSMSRSLYPRSSSLSPSYFSYRVSSLTFHLTPHKKTHTGQPSLHSTSRLWGRGATCE